MDPIMGQAKLILARAFIEAYPQLVDKCPPPTIMPASAKIEVPADYSCTSPMQLNKLISQFPSADGTKTNPIEIAEKVVSVLQSDPEFCSLFEGLTVTKPGFVNFVIKHQYAGEQIMRLIRAGGSVDIKHAGEGRVIVDYSSPNIAKEMHVGHLRSTIIGDCIARLLEYANYDVLRLNHIGDWGTQFGMLLALLFERFGEDYTKSTEQISNLQNFYKEAKKRFDEDEEFKKRSYETVVLLQSKDPKAIKAWQHICDISRKEFSVIYERLCIEKLVERGESFYHEFMKEVVKDLEERQLLVEDEGRKILWPNEKKGKNDIPLTIVKSDGGFTYDTSDLAALRHRVTEEKGTRIIYVADNGQAVHFQSVFAAARRVGYVPDAVKLEHVGFGLVLGEDRKKFKTRSGDTVRLAELLDEGLQRSMAKLIEKKRQEVLTADEMIAAQEATAYGCIKYADLSRDRNKDYVFSFDQMLDDKGNTAVYLLYSLTRIRSIKRKADLGSVSDVLERRSAELGDDHPFELTHKTEIELAKFLLRFPDIILQCINDLLFHNLCNYLYELSGVFTNFYEACYCIERSGDTLVKIHLDRILLCEATAFIMDKGLTLLGLKTLSRM
uniref:arginine--tRNA ligase n=1 Tax=Aceria tosichella TaxID=561515 RepID=A0A6G1SMF8_9ACAR